MKDSIIFVGRDEWKVIDLYRFLHALNVLYNRLYILDEYSSQEYHVLISLLKHSLRYMPEKKGLQVSYISMHSPFEINLKGSGELPEQLREHIKDRSYRNKIEKERLMIEKERESIALESDKLRLSEQGYDLKIKKTELVIGIIERLKKAGFSDHQIGEIMKMLENPTKKLLKSIDEYDIEVLEDDDKITNIDDKSDDSDDQSA